MSVLPLTCVMDVSVASYMCQGCQCCLLYVLGCQCCLLHVLGMSVLPLTCVRDVSVASYMCYGCQCCLLHVLGMSVLSLTCARDVSVVSICGFSIRFWSCSYSFVCLFFHQDFGVVSTVLYICFSFHYTNIFNAFEHIFISYKDILKQIFITHEYL